MPFPEDSDLNMALGAARAVQMLITTYAFDWAVMPASCFEKFNRWCKRMTEV